MSAQDSCRHGSLQNLNKSQQNITWHASTVTREQRSFQNSHRSITLWFTGLSGAGKSTVANAVEEALHAMGCRTFVFDGDNIRHGLCEGLGFSAEDRRENMRRVAEAAKLFTQAGVISLAAFVSPYRQDREYVHSVIGQGDFLEVHCSASIETCEQRDVKGLYRKARAGEIKDFTGISSPYETPERPDLVIDTGTLSVQECVANVIDLLIERKVVAQSARVKARTIAGPFPRLPRRVPSAVAVEKSTDGPGYADFNDLVRQVSNNDPAILKRVMEPDGYLQTRRTTLSEVTEAMVEQTARSLRHRFADDLPTIVFSWGKCRVGSTALTNLFGIADIPAYYNSIKTPVRHFLLNSVGDPWEIPQRSEHEFIFTKNMSGPYHLVDCTVNSLQILVEAGYPAHRIELLVLDRDPYRALDSWLNIWGHLIPHDKLVQHYVLSALNAIAIKAYAARVGIRTSHYVYETTRIPDQTVSRIFRRLGVQRGSDVVENWNEKGALESKHSKIIFPRLPEPLQHIPGMHASESRYLYKERSANRISAQYRALIEQTGVIERYREAALYCCAELDFSVEDRAKIFQGTPLDISGLLPIADAGASAWQLAQGKAAAGATNVAKSPAIVTKMA
jgi:adenylylsulfate kinase